MLSDLSEFITEKQPIDFPDSTLATMRFLDIAFILLRTVHLGDTASRNLIT